MACGCRGGAGAGNTGNTIGYYVILPNGTLLPSGINPDNPDAGSAPFSIHAEAHREVVFYGGGTIKRLRRTKTG